MHTAGGRQEVLRCLTEREREYLKLVCRYPKPTNEQVAEHMGLKVKTVEKHIAKLHKKLDVTCHVDLLFVSVRLGLVRCPCGATHSDDGTVAALKDDRPRDGEHGDVRRKQPNAREGFNHIPPK